jgi:hypothetical protein
MINSLIFKGSLGNWNLLRRGEEPFLSSSGKFFVIKEEAHVKGNHTPF